MMHETIAAAPARSLHVNSTYYESEGGRRVTQGGVPCKVYSRPRSKETREVIDRMALAIAGECDWAPHPDLPGFTFTPADKANVTTKAPKASTGPTVSAKYQRAYYADGYRVVIDGVPCKVASKPTKNRMELLRQSKAFAPVSDKIEYGGAGYEYDENSARFTAKRCEARYAAAMAETLEARAAVQLDLTADIAPAPAPVVEMAERPRVRLRLVQGDVVEACPPVVEKVQTSEAPAVESAPAPAVEIDAAPSTESPDIPTETAETSTAEPVDENAALLARIAKLESVVDDLMVIALREAPAEILPTISDISPAHDKAEPAPLPADPRARAAVTSRDTRAVEIIDATGTKRLRIVRRYLAMRRDRAALRAMQVQYAIGQAQYDAVKARLATTEQALDDATARIERGSADARRYASIEQALIDARARGDRMARVAMRQRTGLARAAIDLRGARAETGAVRRQLAHALQPAPSPVTPSGTMAIAFGNARG